jgi:putative Mg2+ transporter-C (MgtC) family protein
VTGIGFLGAGAIIKYGTSIRGLTTAGSLWATAAIGMAAGAGQIIVAVVGTAIVVFSLWPLNRIVDRLRIGRDRTTRVRLQLGGLDRVGAITTELAAHRVEIAGIEAQRSGKSRFEVELDLRAPATMRPDALLELIASIPDVDVLESSSLGE